MQKLKPLLPTLKEHKQYFVYEILSKSPLEISPEEEILAHIKGCFGLFDATDAGLLSMGWSQEKQKGILNVNRKFVNKSRLALALLQKIGKKQVIAQTVGVSGILKKSKSKFFKGKNVLRY